MLSHDDDAIQVTMHSKLYRTLRNLLTSKRNVVLVILVIFVLFHVFPRDGRTRGGQGRDGDGRVKHVPVPDSLTIVVREYEDFDNRLYKTIASANGAGIPSRSGSRWYSLSSREAAEKDERNNVEYITRATSVEVPGLPTHDARCHHSRLVETGCAKKLFTVYKPYHSERKGQWVLSNFCSHETSKKFLVYSFDRIVKVSLWHNILNMHDALKVSVTRPCPSWGRTAKGEGHSAKATASYITAKS